jgi:phage portal protein BeeE
VTSLLRRMTGGPVENRFTVNDLLQQMQYGGINYPFIQGGTPSGKGENIESSFEGYVSGAYKSNGVVFACMLARMTLFSEARFQFRQMRFGRPGDLFGTAALGVLEKPWPNGTTGDLLAKAITDVDLAGNFYAVRRGDRLVRLRPDWVTILTGSRTGSELDAEVVGYLYQPGGPASSEEPIGLLPEHVAHFAPIPDPVAKFRGMSWLTPILEELLADKSATTHKRAFFENGAKLGYVVMLGDNVKTPEQFEKWTSKFKLGHEGDAANAYKTLFLTAGADVKTVGANLQELDFAKVQNGGELRVCAAAGSGLNLIIGLGGPPTYANFGEAKRAFADVTMRPLWRNIAGSLAGIIDVPGGAELWYDGRDIPFLQEDQQDAAQIQQTQAITIRELINAGYEPDTVVKAVLAQDYTLLKHTGLVSVQLQEPGAQPDASASAKPNGNGQLKLPASTS